ncbi:HET-domain-containing protein [Karstenula rhodostoma CBS 690.94]|uniref:HET-domain-containing protein n=1 Tax=Karstenula rhodostoma CBS 690.94 TaxID=1392251 RepID=A0A9P4UBS7_9PLEO|nr:HET-domain-containing protein [Karstenula rhodostoma CBS 690.94]
MAAIVDRSVELKPYEYEPLSTPNTIRIFCLEPSDAESDPLNGYLLHFDRYEELAKAYHWQKYTAVSYTWGVPNFSERLKMNKPGIEHESYLTITASVRVMLEHFRKRHKRLYLWIDAICLNQNDGAEKAQQIPLMGEIYHQAHKSYFWLGLEEGFQAAKVFTYFHLLAITESRPNTTSSSGNDHPETNATNQVQEFLKRGWFFRRWILQEAGLSRHGIMWCGRHTIQYDLFVFACRKLSRNDFDISNNEKRLCDTFAIKITVEIHDLVHGSHKPQDVLDLIWKFHQSQCSDEKDRVGALYGLLPSSMRPMVSLETPYLRIYETCAVELARRSSDRLIMHLAHFQPVYLTKSVRAPSWIPDWSRERRKPPLPFVEDKQVALSAYLRKGFREQLHHQQSVDYCKDQASWRDFLGRQCQIIHQCTRISSYYDNNSTEVEAESSNYTKSAVLRIQWFHPITHRYGIPICNVMTVPTKPEETWVPVAFARDLQAIAKRVLEQHRLEPFCALIARLTLDPGDKSKVSDILACFTDMTSRTPELESLTGQFDTQHLSSGHVVQALATFLFKHSLALLEWDCGKHNHMYAVGPSTLEVGDRLIPLDNLPSVSAQKNIAFMVKIDDSLPENFMGVKLHHHESSPITRAAQPDTTAAPMEAATRQPACQPAPVISRRVTGPLSPTS